MIENSKSVGAYSYSIQLKFSWKMVNFNIIMLDANLEEQLKLMM